MDVLVWRRDELGCMNSRKIPNSLAASDQPEVVRTVTESRGRSDGDACLFCPMHLCGLLTIVRAGVGPFQVSGPRVASAWNPTRLRANVEMMSKPRSEAAESTEKPPLLEG